MQGLSAPDWFQAAGYNQDTILVTSSITLQLTTESKRSGTEWGGPALMEPQRSTKSIMYVVKHFPGQKSKNSNSAFSPHGYPPPILIQLFFFTSGKLSGVSLLSLLTDAFIYCSVGIWNFTLHPCSCSKSASTAVFKSQCHHSIVCLYCWSPPYMVF